MTELSDYERGVKEGRVDALLDEHTARLNKINGSIDRFSKSHENLAKAISVGLEKVASDLRQLQEEARARELAVEVARKTLAEETDRRRNEDEAHRIERAEALEVAPRTWGVRAAKVAVAGVCISAVVALVVVLSFYLAHK